MLKQSMELSRYTCFGVGGPAEFFAAPKDTKELNAALHDRPIGSQVTILGGGSNVLVNDAGIRGLVILTTELKEVSRQDGGKIKCMAGALSITVSNFAAEHGLAGLEFLSGIPGTIGGAICGNAGAYGGAMSDIVESIEVMDYTGGITVIPAAELGFAYRTASIPKDTVIISATLNLTPGDKTEIKNKMQTYREQRLQKQPVGVRTCGSLFKNPLNDSAGRLIEAAGWKGREINGAAMSEKHANFLVNLGTANAADLESLANAVHADVLSKFGVDLDWEIKRI